MGVRQQCLTNTSGKNKNSVLLEMTLTFLHLVELRRAGSRSWREPPGSTVASSRAVAPSGRSGAYLYARDYDGAEH